jgi:zinc protease
MIITLVGAITAAEAERLVTAVFGDWQNPHKPARRRRRMHPARRKRCAPWFPCRISSKRIFVSVCPDPRRSAPDYLDASLMNTVLGVFGMMGRIGQKVRGEMGVAYYAYSQLQGGLGPGPWSAAAGVPPEAVEPAIQGILEEIERIQQDPVSPEELADSIAYRTGSLPVGLETNGGLASGDRGYGALPVRAGLSGPVRSALRAITPRGYRLRRKNI